MKTLFLAAGLALTVSHAHAAVSFEDLRGTDGGLNSQVVVSGSTAKQIFLALQQALAQGGSVQQDFAAHREILKADSAFCIRSSSGEAPVVYFCKLSVRQ